VDAGRLPRGIPVYRKDVFVPQQLIGGTARHAGTARKLIVQAVAVARTVK
jgi:hypothetical protein